ncbi:MAG: hypothetical protein ACOCXH_06905 [Cyclobacteriaceae bacterium]
MKINRREFISKSAAGVAGLSILSMPGITYAKPGDQIKFGLVTYLWAKDWTLPELIKNCEKSGALGVELRVDHAHNVSPKLSAEEREEVKKQFAEAR